MKSWKTFPGNLPNGSLATNILKEIGAHFGISESGVSLASYRFSQVLQRDKKLRKKIEQVQNQLN